MHIQTIRTIANGLGIKTGKLTKSDLIRSIQKTEGNFDCFGSANDGYCDQYACNWREDCLPAAPVAEVKPKTPATKKKAAVATPAKPKAAPKPKAATKPRAATGKTPKSK